MLLRFYLEHAFARKLEAAPAALLPRRAIAPKSSFGEIGATLCFKTCIASGGLPTACADGSFIKVSCAVASRTVYDRISSQTSNYSWGRLAC
jgi:hypothetical protein